MNNKPAVCRQCGCVGASCKYRKSKEEYPYYDCEYYETKDAENETENEND